MSVRTPAVVSSPTVAELVRDYRDFALPRLADTTRENTETRLQILAKELGHYRAQDLRPIDLLRWYRDHPRWKAGYTIKGINQVVQRVFNWSVRAGLLPFNPVRHIELDITLNEGQPMEDADFRALVRATDASFRRLLYALYWTGARPSELANATWANVDWAGSRIILAKHKTVRKTNRPRIIYCPAPMMAMLRWMERNRWDRLTLAVWNLLQTGPKPAAQVLRLLSPAQGGPDAFSFPIARRLLYCNARADLCRALLIKPRQNTPWHLPPSQPAPLVRQDVPIFLGHRGCKYNRRSLCLRISRLRKKTGLALTMYGLRRAFAHRCIRQGLNLKVASLLLGHQTTAMIERHYLARLADDVSLLQGAVAEVNRRRV